jgi:uncharacterized SAM-binding protein YcdF (DUF218 family)
MISISDRPSAARTPPWVLALTRIAGLLAGLFVVGFIIFTGVIERSRNSSLHSAEGIVALTGGEARIPEAVKLLANNHGKRLLISGVNPATTRIQLSRLNPQNGWLFRCCIDLGKNARDTVGNARETAAWVRRHNFKTLIVVTSSYHMPRSLMELRRVLPETVLIPHAVQPADFETERWWNHGPSFRILLSEYIKMYPCLARYAASRLAGVES